ncbi:hypothetical protein M501DRAFT_913215, partial [Patellaria atrata CBS 101060]
EIERLKEAVHAKLLLNSQRMKAAQTGPGMKSSAFAARRVSPIKEEVPNAVSPSLDAAFSSPLPTGAQTASTESTESGKTIRGSVPATPGQYPLRTPSYPFPYVPGTPRAWSSSFHQPFTTLSPTVSGLPQRTTSTAVDTTLSGDSTPAASTDTFMPRGGSIPGPQDPKFPSPNLYDLVLVLNTEPGLDAWWSTVVTILTDWFGAVRVTLAVPADATDIENVPWGQKATYNFNLSREGPLTEKENKASHTKQESSEKSARLDDIDFHDAVSSKAPRPKIESRHSFAGPEPIKKWDIAGEGLKAPAPSLRPHGPVRTVSHVPHSSLRSELSHTSPITISRESPPSTHRTPLKEHSFSDPDFSSVGDGPAGPDSAVFPVLRALDHEIDPLIDSAGINRVLERGKLVTLTRDYTSTSDSAKPTSSEPAYTTEATLRPKSRQANATSQATKGSHRAWAFGMIPDDNPRGRLSTHYEEYEQFPSSPWAQSPAPSPAIQADPSENPFFTSAEVDEETFNPSGSGPDYSQFGQVEAIGVDSASTIIHLPFIHPVLSQPMSSLDPEPPPMTENTRDRGKSRAGSIAPTEIPEFQKKAPIAILSLLTKTVPYPHNLTHSLKLFGPHLATSFSIAQQYSNAITQAMGVRHRRFLSGQQVGFTPETEGLEDLMRLDITEEAHSTAGSITSPSDYSGRSRHSPGGSITGTPAWDPSNIAFSSRHSVGGTPAALLATTDSIDSYFDAKKKSTIPRTGSGAALSQLQAGGKTSPTVEFRTATRPAHIQTPGDDDATPRIEPKPRLPTQSRNEKTPITTYKLRESSPPRSSDTSASRKPGMRLTAIQPPERGTRQRHSLLHSYGADFSSSFQSLPSAATPTPRTPGGAMHNRSGSADNVYDMPPPSERLLRTIIDSLPVQIFTAAPTTGALTWVNSKFLVYRGQDQRQFLKEPWQAVHPEDRDEYSDAWTKCLRTGQQLQHKVRLQRFDGNYRWFYVRAAPLKDKRQNIVHWIGTNMDFHEQHIAEVNSARQQETAASEAKYRALANSSPQIVFAVTQTKGLIFCNSQWLSYSGQSEQHALKLGFMDFVHPDDLGKCRLPTVSEDGTILTADLPTSVPPDANLSKSETSSSSDSSETGRTVTSPDVTGPSSQGMPQSQLSKLASTGILKVSKDADGRPSYSTEVRLRSKDGDYRWHLVRILLAESIAQDGDEEDVWYGTCTDINDHKLLEQTLKETMDAKSRFLSNMSHEIRTPLNGITGMVNFLMDSNLSPEQMEHVNIIRNSTEGLRDLINDILDLSKVEAGMITLAMDWLHVRSLIEEVNDLTSALAIGKGLELNYVVDEDVPSAVKGDRFRIRQVLLNVIGNAIKFTQTGEVFIRCRKLSGGDSLPEDEVILQFDVIDTGRGFNEKEAQYLFKRFSQIDASSTRQHGGTGLGLAISMQLVELHGGSMRASSVPGNGSTFTFTIKFKVLTANEYPSTDPMRPSVSVNTPLDPPTLASIPSRSPEMETLNTAIEAAVTAQQIPGSPGFSHPSHILSPKPPQDSPAMSSGSSDPSIRTAQTSIRSERSSVSSYSPEPSLLRSPSITLSLPRDPRIARTESDSSIGEHSNDSEGTVRPSLSSPSMSRTPPQVTSVQPPLYSILVVCPLLYSREATVKHIEMTLPKNVPHQITARENLQECHDMIGGDDPVIFTHIVTVLQEPEEVIGIMDQVFRSGNNSTTSIIVIADLLLKREIMKEANTYDFNQLNSDRRLRFIYKPLKPSKFAIIFDPQKEREMSKDRNQDNAQQVAVSQKQVFDHLKNRLGNKGHRVLLVEDNKINQTVILKFLSKASIAVETVLDGVQCTEKVFAKDHGYYSIILCDLHMPNKDGYQTCKEIRKWEKRSKFPYLPIIALSANVLGDVYAKCVEAGFNSYVTKPVDFKELSDVMTKFLDPAEKGRPHEFMR